MDNSKVIEQMKIFQNYLLDFLDTDDASKENYENIRKFCLSSQNSPEIKKLLLIIIEKVIHNHHHSPNFFDKVLQISDIIFPTYLNHPEIFNIFKNDKILLLILYERLTQQHSDDDVDYLLNGDDVESKCFEYLNDADEKIIEDRKCENDSLICEFIRNDSIEDFIIYVNKNCVQLNNYTISESVYETNSFLIGKKPTLIEYSAFFGSIQIFRYLNARDVELTPSLWIYGIHSNNPEMINILEEKKIEFSSTQILKEAIKCHHNEIAEYILNNYGEKIEKSDIDLYVIKYHNYRFYPPEFPKDDGKFFVNACRYGQYFIVRDILRKNQDEALIDFTIEIPYKSKHIINKTKGKYDDDNDDDDDSPFYDFADWNESSYKSMKSRRMKQKNQTKNNIYKISGSALNFAVENEDINMINLLLEECIQIDVNHKMIKYYKIEDKIHRDYIDAKREEKTPLHIAIEKGNLEIIKMLCEVQDIDVNMKTYEAYPSSGGEACEMKTPINIALENNNTSIASYLLHLPNFDVNKLSIEEVWWGGGRDDYCEKTPLVLAVEKENLTICKELLQNHSSKIDIDKRLIEFYAMANLSYLHKLKKTPLHIAIGNKNHKIVKELLDNHSNIRAFDVKEYRYYHFDRKKQLKTPLFLAIENNDIEMVKLLLSYDDIETKYGLLNLNGCEYPIRSGQYHPRIRNDIQKITDEKKVAYFLREKGNYDTSGYFSESDKRLNDEKYINMVEEEDFDDDYSFIYEIYDNISPIKAAETIKNDKIKKMVQFMFDKQHYNDEEESDDKEDTDVKFFFCKDYFC